MSWYWQFGQDTKLKVRTGEVRECWLVASCLVTGRHWAGPALLCCSVGGGGGGGRARSVPVDMLSLFTGYSSAHHHHHHYQHSARQNLHSAKGYFLSGIILDYTRYSNIPVINIWIWGNRYLIFDKTIR